MPQNLGMICIGGKAEQTPPSTTWAPINFIADDAMHKKQLLTMNEVWVGGGWVVSYGLLTPQADAEAGFLATSLTTTLQYHNIFLIIFR